MRQPVQPTRRRSPATTRAHVRNHARDMRGAVTLAAEATTGITDLVEEVHRTIASGPGVLGQPLRRPAHALTGLAYAPVRTVAKLVGKGISGALSQLEAHLGESLPSFERDAALAALNGVLGDHLAATDNPLAIKMGLRFAEQPLQRATRKLLVLVHGSCMNERQWTRSGHDHGTALAADLGYTPVYVRYNSGLHISTNGRELATLLEELVHAWPVELDEIALLGHSMGGLVLRSACQAGSLQQHTWRARARNLVCLGSPHHGAPLEQGGNLVDVSLTWSRYSAPFARLGKVRSAGVTDLRYGNVVDEDWVDSARFALGGDLRRGLPLPEDVACFAIAGTISKSTPRVQEAWLGDGLVPVASALGMHTRPSLCLAFPEPHRWVSPATSHLDLLCKAEVYEKLREWLAR